MRIGQPGWWTSLVLAAACAAALVGCAHRNQPTASDGSRSIKPHIPPRKLPVDPRQVDPPTAVVASSSGVVTVAAPGMGENVLVDVYIDGTYIYSVTGSGDSVTIEVPLDYAAGDHALVLVQRTYWVTRVLQGTGTATGTRPPDPGPAVVPSGHR